MSQKTKNLKRKSVPSAPALKKDIDHDSDEDYGSEVTKIRINFSGEKISFVVLE